VVALSKKLSFCRTCHNCCAASSSVVSMTHGFGGVPEDDLQVRAIGSPTTRLSSVEDDFERSSGQPRMSNIPVMVSAAIPAVQ